MFCRADAIIGEWRSNIIQKKEVTLDDPKVRLKGRNGNRRARERERETDLGAMAMTDVCA